MGAVGISDSGFDGFSYAATPMLPRIAIPKAPPNSVAVSDSAEPALASAGGNLLEDQLGARRHDSDQANGE